VSSARGDFEPEATQAAATHRAEELAEARPSGRERPPTTLGIVEERSTAQGEDPDTAQSERTREEEPVARPAERTAPEDPTPVPEPEAREAERDREEVPVARPEERTAPEDAAPVQEAEAREPERDREEVPVARPEERTAPENAVPVPEPEAREPERDRAEEPIARPDETTAPENDTPVPEPEAAAAPIESQPQCRRSEDCWDGDFATVDFCAPGAPAAGPDGCMKLTGSTGCPPPSQPLCTHLERVEPWRVGFPDEVGPLYSCLVRWADAPLGELTGFYSPRFAWFNFGHDDTRLYFLGAVAPALATDPQCGAPDLYVDDWPYSFHPTLPSGWGLEGSNPEYRTWFEGAWWGEITMINYVAEGALPMSGAMAAYGEGMSAPDDAAIFRLLYQPRPGAKWGLPEETWPEVLDAAVCTDWVQSLGTYDGLADDVLEPYGEYPVRSVYDPALLGFITGPSPDLPELECGVNPHKTCKVHPKCGTYGFPGQATAFEVCRDFIDNNCDGLLDEDCAPQCDTHADSGAFEEYTSFCAPGHPEATAEGCVHHWMYKTTKDSWSNSICRVMPPVAGLAPLESGESGHLCALNLLGRTPEWPAMEPQFTAVELEATISFDPSEWALLAVYDGDCTSTSCQGAPLVGGAAATDGAEVASDGSATHVLTAEPASAEDWNASGKVTLRWVPAEGSPLASVPLGTVSTGKDSKLAPTMQFLFQSKTPTGAVPMTRPKLVAIEAETAAGNTTKLSPDKHLGQIGYYFSGSPYDGWPYNLNAYELHQWQFACGYEPEPYTGPPWAPNWEPPPPPEEGLECKPGLSPAAESCGEGDEVTPPPPEQEVTCEQKPISLSGCPAGSTPLCTSLVPFEGDGIVYPLGSYLRCAVSWIDTEPPDSPGSLAGFQLTVNFEAGALELVGVVADLCLETFCWTFPVALPPPGQSAVVLAKGHNVYAAPFDIAKWNAIGAGMLLVVKLAPPFDIATAYAGWPVEEVTGDPRLFHLLFRVTECVDPDAMALPLPCASEVVSTSVASLMTDVSWHAPTGAFVSVPAASGP
jgi:hypothetical protein